eukprot:5771126-Amphidinium_carterae.1
MVQPRREDIPACVQVFGGIQFPNRLPTVALELLLTRFFLQMAVGSILLNPPIVVAVVASLERPQKSLTHCEGVGSRSTVRADHVKSEDHMGDQEVPGPHSEPMETSASVNKVFMIGPHPCISV